MEIIGLIILGFLFWCAFVPSDGNSFLDKKITLFKQDEKDKEE